MLRRLAIYDQALRATIVARRPLRYRAGPDLTLDRPAHLRAGSSLAWIDDRLVLVQDDANFIAVVDPHTGLAEAITLPAGERERRQFDDARGNKQFKLDLEACCVVRGPTGPRLLAFGSGSSVRRRRVVLLDDWQASEPRVTIIDADAMYIALESAADFAGSDLNIEGALALPNVVRLFGRGNGARSGDRRPLNGTGDLPLPALLAYLAAPGDAPPPSLASSEQYDLGAIDGLALGFTDAAWCGGAVLYTAAAEDSASAREDGAIAGSVLGVLPGAGELRQARLIDARGEPTRDKIEGVVSAPDSPDRVFVVVDPDDATQPCELCEVRLDGAWT